jgi:centrosomal protein CEP19
MTGALRPGDIEPRRLGLKYTPPTLVVEFWMPRKSKLMHRLVELPKLSPDQDPTELEAKIRRKNPAYFTNIKPEQVKRLIVQLQKRSASAASSKVAAGSKAAASSNGVDYNSFDLNKLSTEELDKHKAIMNSTFEANVVKPGDPGFVYDVRVDVDPSKLVGSEWDDSD